MFTASLLLGAAVCAGNLLNGTAAAAEFELHSPIVEPGILQFELFNIRTFDRNRDRNNDQISNFNLSYAVTSWWQPEIQAGVRKAPGSKRRYDATELQNTFQLTPEGKYWADLGLLVSYEWAARHNDPDGVELGLLAQKEIGPVMVVANALFGRDIGPNAGKGVEFAYAAGARYRYRKDLQFAVEAYGEPGRLSGFERIADQEHRVGPFLLGAFSVPGLPGVFNYTAGYLFGLTLGTPSGTVKATFEYELPFPGSPGFWR